MVVAEFLTALGLQDNMSKDLDKALKKGEQKVKRFSSANARQFALAGGAVVGFLATAAVGIAKFGKALGDKQEEVTELAKRLGMERQSAFAAQMAIDAMGKSWDEIAQDKALLEQFQNLKAEAEEIGLPDMSAGLEQLRETGQQFTSLKQTAGIAVQWIGFHMLEHIQRPLEMASGMLQKLNEWLKSNIPKITETIGKSLAGIIRLGLRVIQGAQAGFNLIKKLLGAIPGKVKLIGVALAALNTIIKKGPLGIMITLLGIALLLLDDFFTFMEGGESLLGPVWETLSNLFSGFTDGGEGALDFFSGEFVPKIQQAIETFVPLAVEKLSGLITGFAETLSDMLPGIIEGITTLLLGIADVATTLVVTLVDAIADLLPVIIEAGVMILQGLIDGLMAALPRILDAIVRILDALIQCVVDNLPTIVQAVMDGLLALVGMAKELIPKIVQAINETLPKLVEMAGTIITALVDALLQALPDLLQAWVELLFALINGILDSLPAIIDAVMDIVDTLIITIIDALPLIIEAGIELLKALVEGIIDALPKLIDAAIKLIDRVVKTFAENMPKIIKAGIELIMRLIEGIVQALPQLIQQVVAMIPMVVGAILDNLPQLIQAGIEILIALIEGIVTAIPELLAAIPQIISAILEGLAELPGLMWEKGPEIIKALWEGILSMGSWLKDKVSGFVGDVFSGIGDFVGGLFGGGGGSGGGGNGGGHAEGGIFNKEHVAPFCEDDQPEAIVPLNKPNRAKEVLAGVSQYLGMGDEENGKEGGSVGEGISKLADKLFTGLGSMAEKLGGAIEAGGENGMLDQAVSMLGKAAETVSTMQATTESHNQVPTKSAEETNVNNNQQYEQNNTINVYGSDDPNATAGAVDKNIQNQYRNLSNATV